MAEGEAALAQLVESHARQPGLGRGIVVAGDPHRLHRAEQPREEGAIVGRDARERRVVVQRVAQHDEPARRVPAQRRLEALQRFARVVGRQHPPLRREVAALLEVQVGDHERSRGGPEEDARRAEHQPLAREVEGGQHQLDKLFGAWRTKRL